LADEVIAIFGPTASGKSAVAQCVAAALETEVVSADAFQVYRGLEILTNQPAARTRLVGIRDLDATMSVGEYADLAHTAVDELVAEHGSAVVAGGTGLYLRAALADIEIPPRVDTETRARAEDVYAGDAHAAYAQLVELDAVAASTIHVNDRRRVVRALELAAVGSSLAPRVEGLWSEATRRRTLVIGLDVPAAVLDSRIEARTDEMIERGVVDEVERALDRPVSLTARRALGLDELASLPVALARERIVARTRRYATYQRKWMRRIPGIVIIEADRPADEVADAVLDVARAR
jgi:tRNA dimethylallyltransferase